MNTDETILIDPAHHNPNFTNLGQSHALLLMATRNPALITKLRLVVYPFIPWFIGFRPNTSQLVNWDSFDQQYPPDLDKTQPNSTGCLHDLQSKFTSGRYMSVLFLSWRIQELKATKDSHWTKSIDGWPPSKPGIFNEGTAAFCRKLLFVLVYPHFNNDLSLVY